MVEAWQDHPSAPAPGARLCALSDIPDGEGRELRFGAEPGALRIFVVRRGDRAWGYRNCCPHNYIPLNDLPNRFVTYDHEWIVCATHGAVFRFEDGYCEDGPCRGRSLEAVPVIEVAGELLIAPR